jgi:WD40 repeat protein
MEEKQKIKEEGREKASRFESLSERKKRALLINSILVGFLVVLTLVLVGVGIWYFALGGAETKKQEVLDEEAVGKEKSLQPQTQNLVVEKKKIIGEINKAEWFRQWLQSGNGFVFTKKKEGSNQDLPGAGEDAYFYDLRSEKENFLGSIKGLWQEDFVTNFKNGGFGLAIITENGEIAPYFNNNGDKEGDALAGFQNVLEYSFSPDGEKIIYTTTDNYIKIRNFRTGEIKDLGQHVTGINFGEEDKAVARYSAPSWSSDGKYIAFQKELESQTEAQIYTTIFVGGGERGIVVLPAQAQSLDEAFEVGRSYIVESEGIVNFSWSKRDNFLVDGVSRSIYDVYKKETVRQGDKEDWQDISFLKISPEENYALFISLKEKSIYFSKVNGSDKVKLLDLDRGDLTTYSADWSPDGRKIAYTDGTEIFIYDLARKEVRKVFEGGVSIKDLQWSFDGERLGFSENEDVWNLKLSTEAGS